MNGSKPRKSKKRPSERLIDAANELSAQDFQNEYIPTELLVHSARRSKKDDNTHNESDSFSISFRRVDQLDSTQLDLCLDLIASTSQQDYENSIIGWHPRRKKREMREDEMRYLLVTRSPARGKEDSIQGFVSFMLTHDSTPSVPIVYVYEIHLQPSLRRCGLGAHLMRLVETIAQSVGVEKVMLTCFMSNERARKFYSDRGYAIDVSSPEARTIRRKVVEPDYIIMSKVVASGG